MKRINGAQIVVILAALLIVCTTVGAAPSSHLPAAGPSTVVHEPSHQSEPPPVPPRAITVIGRGKVSLVPDVARISVGSETRSDVVSEAKAEVDRQMASIMAALQEMDVAEEDIRTSHYTIHYARELMPALLEGLPPASEGAYRVSTMLQVTVRDVEKAGDVLDAVVDAGANQVHGVSFTVADEGTWLSQAREKAVDDAIARAAELAGLAGVELGEVLSVSEVVSGCPMPMAMESSMGISGIVPGELEMGTQIQVSFAIQ